MERSPEGMGSGSEESFKQQEITDLKNPESKEKEKLSKMKILLVEDNPKFRQAAKNYFKGQSKETDVVYAEDFDEAQKALEENDYDAVITDLFFPKKLGSKDISLGLVAVDKIREHNKESLEYQENHPERYFIDEDTGEKEWTRPPGRSCLELLEKLTNAIQNNESNQPLGVLVAEQAAEKNIPVMIATSTHHHGDLTELVHTYKKKPWVMFDTGEMEKEGDKNEKFWGEAFIDGNISLVGMLGSIEAGKIKEYREKNNDQPLSENLKKKEEFVKKAIMILSKSLEGDKNPDSVHTKKRKIEYLLGCIGKK